MPQALLDEMGVFIDENLKSGVLIDTAGLQPSSETATVRLSRGKVSVTDGPFTEAKEVIGGYAVINARSRAEAIEVATAFVDIHRRNWPEFEFACEVHPIAGDESEAGVGDVGDAVRRHDQPSTEGQSHPAALR